MVVETEGKHQVFARFIKPGFCWLENIDATDDSELDSNTFGQVSIGLLVGYPLFTLPIWMNQVIIPMIDFIKIRLRQ